MDIPKSYLTLDDVIDNTLLESRRILFYEAVDNETARDVIRKLWYLELQAAGKPILFMINCPGGSVDAGFAIWDQVKMLSSPVITLVSGLAASMGSVLSLCATRGNRFATHHARIMIHQPAIHGVVKGQATDLDIHARQIKKTRELIVNLYVECTGQTREVVDRKIERDTWMTAEEAKEFGLLDRVIKSFKELPLG